MTAVRLVIIILALAAINLGLGLAGLLWGVESIKMSPLTLFLTTILYIAAAVTAWIKWRERKERKPRPDHIEP